ncbi:MAG: hypothetical protein WKF43_12505 [Acidimicrobiales bacterium]
MAKPGSDVTLDKGAKVVAIADLRGVPVGTKGKVAVVNGLSWIRYWVRFDNGATVGSINRTALATPREWERRQAGGDPVEQDGAGPEADGGAGGDGDDGGGVMVNGVLLPAKLIERSKAARARLAG